MIKSEIGFLEPFPVSEGEGFFNYCGSTMPVLAGGLLWNFSKLISCCNGVSHSGRGLSSKQRTSPFLGRQ